MTRPTQADFDRVVEQVKKDVKLFGWSDIAVFPVEGQVGPHIHFNYTVGLTELDHPELLIMGMGNEQMHTLLQASYQQIMQGARFEPDHYYEQIVVGLKVAFVEVLDMDHSDYRMSMARQIYGDQITGLQLVWPDAEERFPWHADFNPELRDHQILAGPWRGPM